MLGYTWPAHAVVVVTDSPRTSPIRSAGFGHTIAVCWKETGWVTPTRFDVFTIIIDTGRTALHSNSSNEGDQIQPYIRMNVKYLLVLISHYIVYLPFLSSLVPAHIFQGRNVINNTHTVNIKQRFRGILGLKGGISYVGNIVCFVDSISPNQ